MPPHYFCRHAHLLSHNCLLYADMLGHLVTLCGTPNDDKNPFVWKMLTITLIPTHCKICIYIFLKTCYLTVGHTIPWTVIVWHIQITNKQWEILDNHAHTFCKVPVGCRMHDKHLGCQLYTSCILCPSCAAALVCRINHQLVLMMHEFTLQSC